MPFDTITDGPGKDPTTPTVDAPVRDPVDPAITTPGADLTANTSALTVGRRGDGTYFFKGRVDDVYLFDRVLAEDEIAFVATMPPLNDEFELDLVSLENAPPDRFANLVRRDNPGRGNTLRNSFPRAVCQWEVFRSYRSVRTNRGPSLLRTRSRFASKQERRRPGSGPAQCERQG